MKNRDQEFDRMLMEQMSQLPPSPEETAAVTPWQDAMTRLLLGMALCTFQVEFLYLNYLLPLLGTGLVYLGCRSLRTSGGWFRLCWALSGVKLIWHMVWAVLAATPVVGLVTADPAWKWGLTWIIQVVQLFLLLALWLGTRQAFYPSPRPGPPERDWLMWGVLCHLLVLALALWSELAPACEESMLGVSVTNGWLYYGRPALAVALEIGLLVCLARQSGALAGRGYDLSPAPVRISSRPFLLAVFALVLLAIPPALWLSGRALIPQGETVTQPLSGSQEETRQHLVELGLPEELARWMEEEELARCAQVVAVRPGQWQDDDLTDDLVPQVEDDALTLTVGKTQAELSSWLILLPDGQARWYHWFRYEAGSGLRLQEQFSVDGSSHHHTRDFTGTLFWTAADQVLSAHPQVRLAGGETADELPEWSAWINQEELERFGQLHFSPYFSYSLPADAETVWGCLSYTLDLSAWQSLAGDDPFYDSTHVFLRRQTQLLHYPFADINQLGGARQTGQWGPIQTAYGTCWYNGPVPQ